MTHVSQVVVHSVAAIVLVAMVGASTATLPAMCAIDMGSNTFRRIVGSFENGHYEQTTFEKHTLGVGDDVATHGLISDAKLSEIETTLSAYKASCDKDGASPVVAVATAVFREAPNAHRVADMAAKLGITMEIATEARESDLAYLVGSLGQDGYGVIDNGSRSIELVSREGSNLRYAVFNLGYRVAYDTYFANTQDPRAAVSAYRDRLLQEASKAPFMKGKRKLIGIEFGDMADVLFAPADLEGRILTVQELRRRLDEINALQPSDFGALKKKKDIDRALPRLVTAVVLTEAFGYTGLELTGRELGAGLIIERVATKAPSPRR